MNLMARQVNNQSQLVPITNIRYPLDPDSYRLLDEIGSGVSAIVYKALCLPLNSSIVAIKSIDVDQSRAVDLDNLRRETNTMSLLSHPNILGSHCSFTVDRRLWVVMPFMSGGSLQSIMSSSFPSGLPEPCIAIVLKETLNALAYLHDQGHLHRDVKAGNILVDFDGSIKLADFGVSASVYDSGSRGLMLNDVAGTPYWMAPEVIHSHIGYSFKADIWSFGITALELAHGRPPLSHLPPSKSLLMKVTKRFMFSDWKIKDLKFSKAFKDMVGSCLDQDPGKRPSAHKLLKHPFFKSCKGPDHLVKNVLHGLPSVEERFSERKELTKREEDHENVKVRRISGWSFNEDGFELDPVFPLEDALVKQVSFGGETVIRDIIRKKGELLELSLDSGSGGSGGSSGASPCSPATQVEPGGKSLEMNVGECDNSGGASPSSPATRMEPDGRSLGMNVGECGNSGGASPSSSATRMEPGARSHGMNVGECGNSRGASPNSPATRVEPGGRSLGMNMGENGNSGEASPSSTATRVEPGGRSFGMNVGECGNRGVVLESLLVLKASLDDQRMKVGNLIGMLGGEMTREDQHVQSMERLRVELENEKHKSFGLEMELGFLKLLTSGSC